MRPRRTLPGLPFRGRPAHLFASVRSGAERSHRNIWVLTDLLRTTVVFIIGFALWLLQAWWGSGAALVHRAQGDPLEAHKASCARGPLTQGLCHKASRAHTRLSGD